MQAVHGGSLEHGWGWNAFSRLGPERLRGAEELRCAGVGACWRGWFSTQISISAHVCGESMPCTFGYLSTELNSSSLTVHQLNRFWPKIWCHWKKFSVLRENRSPRLKSFFVSGDESVVGLQGTSWWVRGKKTLVAFIWTIWSQLLWEGCLVLLSEVDLTWKANISCLAQEGRSLQLYAVKSGLCDVLGTLLHGGG